MTLRFSYIILDNLLLLATSPQIALRIPATPLKIATMAVLHRRKLTADDDIQLIFGVLATLIGLLTLLTAINLGAKCYKVRHKLQGHRYGTRLTMPSDLAPRPSMIGNHARAPVAGGNPIVNHGNAFPVSNLNYNACHWLDPRASPAQENVTFWMSRQVKMPHQAR